MNNRKSWLALVWALAASIPIVASGLTPFWFDISVDGKPVFTGHISGGNDDEAIDLFRHLVAERLQLERDSYLDADTTGDVTLEGDIVFELHGLPPVPMDRIRLIYVRDTARDGGGTYVGGYYDWRLHPDDAADIIAYFESIEASERAKAKERTIARRKELMAEAKETTKEMKHRVNAFTFPLYIHLGISFGTTIGFIYWYWRGRKHS